MIEGIFKWRKEESKPVPPPDIVAETHRPESMIDTSVPMFHFTKEEKDSMKAKGMSDDDIAMKEKEVINKLARAQSGEMKN